MNLSKFRFTLDLHSIQSQASIPVMVGDTSVTLIITITDGGLPYHIEDGCLAKISIKRPTGTHLEEFCVVKNNAVVEYAFSQNENTCAVPGVHVCDIILYGADGGVVGTPRFTMVVSERVIRFDDIVLTDEDFTAVDAMVKQEAVRNARELQRVRAEEQRAIAEVGRIAAEAERVNAGKVALQAAEEAKSEADRAKSEADRAMESDPTVPNWAKQPAKPTYTAAEIGAAPAGFGLGSAAVTPPNNSLNEAKTNGWYYASPSYAGAPTGYTGIGYGLVHTFYRDAENITQEFYNASDQNIIIGTPLKLIRIFNENGWSEWEWVNPPMMLGVEYRTTERWMGKAVYTKLFNCGLSANGKGIAHNISGSVIRFSGSFMNGSYLSPLPYLMRDTLLDTDNMYLYVGGSSIVIMCGSGKIERQVYCQLWYTKD